MQNPFESGHIKNYILLYVSVVVIMVLFFIASTLFNDVEQQEKKIFNKKISKNLKFDRLQESKIDKEKKFKLLDKAY